MLGENCAQEEVNYGGSRQLGDGHALRGERTYWAAVLS